MYVIILKRKRCVFEFKADVINKYVVPPVDFFSLGHAYLFITANSDLATADLNFEVGGDLGERFRTFGRTLIHVWRLHQLVRRIGG